MDSSKVDQSNQDDGDLDIKEILGVLWRRRWLIVGLIVIGMAIGGYHAFRIAVPKYAATVSLALQVRNANVVDLKSVISGVSTETSSINTELEVIRSRELLGKLVTELNLVQDPEFNVSLQEESRFSLAEIKGAIQDFIANDNGDEEVKIGDSEEGIFNATVATVREAVGAAHQRNTYIFEISAISENSVKSTLIANTLARLYIQDQIDVKFQATEDAISWLSERVVALDSEIKEKENAIKDLSATTDLTTSEGLLLLNQQARDIRERIADTQADAELQEARVNRFLTLKSSRDYDEIAKISDDATLTRLLDQARLGDEDAGNLLEERLTFLMDRETTNLTRIQLQLSALSDSSRRLSAQITSQSSGFSELQQLQRELETTRTLHDTFLTRLKETTVQRGLQQADSRILSKATRGTYVEPQKSQIIFLYGLLGLALGIVAVLARHFLHNGFRTAEQVEAATGRIVLGQIPNMPIKDRSDLVDYLNDKPTSAGVEAVRNLRTSVLLSDIDQPPQVIMSTSSIPGEGKTTLALALAHNLSGLGKRVLLIDGDTRRRTLANYIDVPEHVSGIATAMTSGKPIENYLVRSENIGFDVLLGEKSAINAADLFSSEKFKILLSELRSVYDFIIIDTPPVLVVPDARIIGQLVDAVVFSVAWDRTSKFQVVDSLRGLATVGVKVTGIALSQIDPIGMKKYGYGSYSNYVGDYYSN